ncbi:hypothetical protein [Magnetospirillum sp. 64-120]|uniref:hypothetical protein n=1 Tax=Magnetospirillum sp. 64-120 TaxID=1895778 RepID=UPI00092763F9|nr:hypothetical protein [Magnetospirillum sp. 64-120]OJX68447.1 MAG: hypothetical protein BGO92_18635 [Magnetospirillum sp. 64-120]
MKQLAASACIALLLAACAQDAPGVETHLIDDPKTGSVKVAVWPRELGVFDVVVFEPGFITFPSPYILDTRAARTEVVRKVLSDGRCGGKAPVPVDTHFENNIQMMRFECR